jgi:hypothetical protein
MPNHVQNRVTITGKTHLIDSLIKFVKHTDAEGHTSDFAFESILPMPEELKGTRAPANIISPAEYKKQEYQRNFGSEPNPFFDDKGGITQKMSDEWKEKYGADNWYDWTTSHWGTKWGSYEVSMIEGDESDGIKTVTYFFQTAWAAGYNATIHLAELYPDLTIRHEWADEDCGYNVGDITMEGGFCTEQVEFEGGSNDAMMKYFDLWNDGSTEGWKQVDGEWVWDEEDD